MKASSAVFVPPRLLPLLSDSAGFCLSQASRGMRAKQRSAPCSCSLDPPEAACPAGSHPQGAALD
eukprot:6831937-Prymnesium_polylepis.2